MADVLSTIWFASAIGGGLAALIALAVPARRSPLLVVAGALFLVAGVLGILSIGILFIALAALCLVKTGRSRPARDQTSVT